MGPRANVEAVDNKSGLTLSEIQPLLPRRPVRIDVAVLVKGFRG
jgi:hypothetical protein